MLLDEGGDLVNGELVSRGLSIVIKDSMQVKSATDNIGTFDRGNKDIRFSFDDEDYLLAVRAGDMDAAQEMVDEAAKKTGYTVKAYHGTNENFNVFRSEKGRYFFSKSEDYAEAMMEERIGQRMVKAYLKMENPYREKLAEGEFSDPSFEKPILDYAEQNGYDSAIIEVDTDNEMVADTFYVVFSPEQIKSADPVAYDDNGRIIPLSERFNTRKTDIRYSIDEEFEADIDQWEEDGRPEGESFILGSTGDVLQGLGAIESDIYMQGDKIKTILWEHPEMSLDEIKKIPEMLDDPVLILKSRNIGRGRSQNTRVIVFGSVTAKNGMPVLAVMDMRPMERNLVIDDMQKVTSAYTKNNGERFIRSSEVVYADKKRTAKLLRTIGFQMPIELQQSGYIGSISYHQQNVNISGEIFSEIVRERTEDARYSIEDDVAETDEAYRQEMDSKQKPHRTAEDLKREIKETLLRGEETKQTPTSTVTLKMPASDVYKTETTVTHEYGIGKPFYSRNTTLTPKEAIGYLEAATGMKWQAVPMKKGQMLAKAWNMTILFYPTSERNKIKILLRWERKCAIIMV